MTASVVITTRNRAPELARALESVLRQSVRAEILVFDDDSTDGTAGLVRERFPAVRYIRSPRPLGVVAARNEAIKLASGGIVFTIDDDCVMDSPLTIERTLADFDHPRIAVVAIPHIDVYRSRSPFHAPPEPSGTWVSAQFAGGSNALRRDLFLSLGGYRSAYHRQAEEYDLSTRLLDAGYVVRCGSSAPILHFESPIRDNRSVWFNIGRSFLLYAWFNVPRRYLSFHAAGTFWNCLTAARRDGYTVPTFRGLLSALRDSVPLRSERRPIDPAAYRLYRRLRRTSPVPLAQIERLLPAAMPYRAQPVPAYA